MLIRVAEVVLKFCGCFSQIFEEFFGYVRVKFVKFVGYEFIISDDVTIVIKIYFSIFAKFVMDNFFYAFPDFTRVVKVFLEILLKIFPRIRVNR